MRRRAQGVGASTSAEAWGPSTTGRRSAVCQKPLGWELPMVTMKRGSTVVSVVLCTSTVTESSRVAAWEEANEATSRRRGGELKASTDTTTAAAAGTRTARPSGMPQPVGDAGRGRAGVEPSGGRRHRDRRHDGRRVQVEQVAEQAPGGHEERERQEQHPEPLHRRVPDDQGRHQRHVDQGAGQREQRGRDPPVTPCSARVTSPCPSVTRGWVKGSTVPSAQADGDQRM